MSENKSQKAKWRYDLDGDIFSARPLKRSYDSSVQIGDIIFDLDEKGKINGFEIVNVSKLFGIPKIFLKNIQSGKLQIEVGDQYIRLKINIKSLVRNAQRSSALNIERIRPEFIKQSDLKLAVASS